ncbi:TonB-dependent receptor domain-containing protein [Pelagerythrobacter marensis]|uniref:TonB-dependent receptor n=1 Tax=Pelagerythrobacter marensis TaxID=543877 RepID=A0A0G3X4G4_9SPHN|nr:TonB-dependent receptor [Pelagerythrobacter marensis]AKM06460.1 TonB-dependent receptor [Pelagerythrobacter marensis]
MRLLEIRSAFSAIAVALCVGASGTAIAQDDTEEQVGATPGEVSPDSGEVTIVVTGSRVRRDTFNAASPIDVFTKEDAVLGGVESATDLLQSNTVTSGSGQINDTFVGYVSDNGPGAATIGLRGFGASRTLTLLNGRRVAPAGAGPQLIAADLNVLPLGVVQRIEVLREGASAVYGSDAVAGVVNIVTETDYDGVTLDFYTNQPIEHGGGGRTYRASVTAGKTFDRGHITGSLEYRERTGMRFDARSDFTCPQDGFVDATTGEPVGQLIPGTNELRCHPFQAAGNGTAQYYMLGIDYFSGQVGRFTYNQNDPANADPNTGFSVDDYDLRPTHSKVEDRAHVIPPIQTVTGFIDASYEVTPSIEAYMEGLYTRRRSHYDYSSQISWDGAQTGAYIYGGPDGQFIRDTFDDGVVTPFYPNAAMTQTANGYQELRFFIVPPLRRSKQAVDYGRIHGGFRGDLGISDWRFDANLMYSRTDATSRNQNIDSRLLRNSIDVVLAPDGTPAENITTAIPGQFGYVDGGNNSYTCRSNVDGGGNFIAGSACVPFDPFNPQSLAGNIPQNVMNYIYFDNVGKTKFDQWTGQLVVDGSLFELPGGSAGFALGYEHRRDYINDVPSEASQTGNVYNYSSSGITTGKDTVNEVFGELVLPLLANRPMVHELTIEGSVRYTDYKTYGSDWTYGIRGQYAPVPEFRFRGGYQTTFRAPNLYEQFVADQSGFFGYDPCDEYVVGLDPASNAYQNCDAEIGAANFNNDSDGDGVLDNWVANSTPQTFTKGGAGVLNAETGTSYGFGGVLDLPLGSFSNISLAVDYWYIKVEGQVGQLGTSILDRCYDSSDFRSGNFFCTLVSAREDSQNTLVSFDDPYLNIAQQKADGIDFNLRFDTELAGGRLVAQAHATRNLSMVYQSSAEVEPDDYLGLLGYHGTTGGPKWVGSFDLRYTTSDEKWTFRYGVDYTGKMDSTEALQSEPINFRGTTVVSDQVAEAYWEHALSIQYNWEGLAKMTLGVNNLFNEKPPVIGSYGTGASSRRPTIGNYFNYGTYDFLGRQVFLNVTRSF